MGTMYTRKHKRIWIVGVVISLLSFATMVKYTYLYYMTIPRTIGVSGHYDLIINAYQRSGSSWLGSLFNLRKDTFYWYEPLWSRPMHTLYFSRDGLTCANTKQQCSKRTFLEDSITFLGDIYDCRLVNHSPKFKDAFSDQNHGIVTNQKCWTRFPLFEKAQRYEVFLEPGDVLFIPAGWLHSVISLVFGVAVNVFWRHLSDDMYDNRDTYGNRDPTPATRAFQIVDRAIKTLEELPNEYRDFYARRLIARIDKKAVDDFRM